MDEAMLVARGLGVGEEEEGDGLSEEEDRTDLGMGKMVEPATEMRGRVVRTPATMMSVSRPPKSVPKMKTLRVSLSLRRRAGARKGTNVW
jgi:hypothetical protein